MSNQERREGIFRSGRKRRVWKRALQPGNGKEPFPDRNQLRLIMTFVEQKKGVIYETDKNHFIGPNWRLLGILLCISAPAWAPPSGGQQRRSPTRRICSYWDGAKTQHATASVTVTVSLVSQRHLLLREGIKPFRTTPVRRPLPTVLPLPQGPMAPTPTPFPRWCPLTTTTHLLAPFLLFLLLPSAQRLRTTGSSTTFLSSLMMALPMEG